jgi:hypothetical protein
MHGRELSAPGGPRPARSKLRLALGLGQIAGVGFSLGLLYSSGLTPLVLGAVVGTCLLTAVSVLLFGGRNRG